MESKEVPLNKESVNVPNPVKDKNECVEMVPPPPGVAAAAAAAVATGTGGPETEAKTGQRKDETAEDLLSQETSIRTLTDGHSVLKAKLNTAQKQLADKKICLKQLQDDISRQQERNLLIGDRIQILCEMSSFKNSAVERGEKREEVLYSELVDIKWKTQGIAEFINRLKNQREQLEAECAGRIQDITAIEAQDDTQNAAKQQLRNEISKLQYYKTEIANGNIQFCSILNGDKMMEVEQRKSALLEAIEERDVSLAALNADIAERTELIKEQKKKMEETKTQFDLTLRQLRSKFRCSLETEARLQRSRDYNLAKIDYGINVPAPPPWPDFETMVRSRKFNCLSKIGKK